MKSLRCSPTGASAFARLNRRVLGKTLPEAEALIAEAYRGILNKPVVSVLLQDFLKPSFYASGEVGRPGRYEILSDITLVQALSEAGGLLNERASKKEIVVFRPQGNGTYESKVIDVKQLLEAKGPEEDYAILPGDVFTSPRIACPKFNAIFQRPTLGHTSGRRSNRAKMREDTLTQLIECKPLLPTRRDLVARVFRQRTVFVVCLLLVIAGFIVTRQFQPKYQAEMKVLLRKDRVDPVVTTGQNSTPELQAMSVREEDLNSQVEILKEKTCCAT